MTGISIALVDDDDDIVWTQGFGYADQEARITATENTVYRVGSLSKFITALVVHPVSDNEAIVLGGETHGFFKRTLRFENKDGGEILLLGDIPYTQVGK